MKKLMSGVPAGSIILNEQLQREGNQSKTVSVTHKQTHADSIKSPRYYTTEIDYSWNCDPSQALASQHATTSSVERNPRYAARLL